MEAAQLAPTAMNQQKFMFTLDGNRVSAKAGAGFYTKLDLGIVKYQIPRRHWGDGKNQLNRHM